GLPAIKVKLIKHRMFGFDDAIENDFRATLLSFGVSNSQEVNYGPGLKIFSLPSPSRDLLDDLTRFVGLHTLSGFPIYYPVRTQALPIGAPQTRHYPLPMPDASYPVIGIIDSGIQRGIPFLEPWIVGRENYVPHNRAHYGHGTFVAGLATYARRLNHHDPRFPSCSSKILDVAVMSSDGLSEDMLLTILEDVLPRYPQVKYWNISLGTNEPISYDLFSDFAVGLDRLQREYDVTFVLAAGNHQSFMSAGHNNTIEVLCAPADSVRSIVVGAVAHTATASSLSSMEEVAPFSRRGPGPVYLPKPDLSHYGGNCDSSGACRQSGVVSVDHNGMLAEDIGTSFAAPLIATLAANLSETIVGGASKNLTKALLIHAAAMRSEVTEPEALHERGFGVPPDLNEILRCEAWNCTMIFEAPMRPGNEYRKIDFPMARSLFLENGKIRADILMTLVYDPELDASFGSEYCRTNIEASLGTLRRGKDGKWVHKKEVPEDPKLTGSAYEQDLVEGGFKWSPVKVYRRKIARGIQGERWQLVLSLLDRGGHKTYAEQPAALIITIADPAKRAPVYNETVAMMNRLGWGAQNLAISQRVQI
ncbi:S8 family peptidase, partial [Desulfovibrio sp. OttesenSCG-928-A18]|nr:S8 family peptidase [Desulfovibrio sp. OttesenSCG-928-A18]